jgi:hypothetical protein
MGAFSGAVEPSFFQAQWNHHSAIISILPDEIR